MLTINTTHFSPKIELQVKVVLHNSENLDNTADARNFEKVNVPQVVPCYEQVENVENAGVNLAKEETQKDGQPQIVGGSWTIDPNVILQLLDEEILKQIIVKAFSS